MKNKILILSSLGLVLDGEGVKPKVLRKAFSEFKIIYPTLLIVPNIAIKKNKRIDK